MVNSSQLIMTETRENQIAPEAQETSATEASETGPTETESVSMIPAASETCVNHPGKKAFRVCKSCGKNFCAKCMTHWMGEYYCEECGEKARKAPVTDKSMQAYMHMRYDTDDAKRIFRLALIGLIPILGLVVEIIVLFKGFAVMSKPNISPGVDSSKQARNAILIATGSFLIQVFATVILVVKLL